MPKAETYIQFIIEELQKGNVEPTKVCAAFCSKFHKSERTFYNHWNIAQERHTEAQQAINKAKDDIYQANEIEALKSGLKSKIERQLQLQKMIEPDYKHHVVGVEKGKTFKYKRPLTPNEIQIIHAELSKMAGDYNPSKTAITDTNGNDIISRDIIKSIAEKLK